VAHLYLCPESDSMYLDVTGDAGAPHAFQEAAPGVWLHLDEAGDLVGIEVFRLAERGGLDIVDLDQRPEDDPLPDLDQLTVTDN
jgi:uncharacterized protein YuzE